ncbi:unnamed protein product [Strongylus vulgaris]|uniref:Uncharacterized protein n=1 Tax=Strongylus vulgaris TaxID=40348 RepID=A0A3P7J7M3_STRVU|nr:unnamed protein product [Strongylus vulgaris]
MIGFVSYAVMANWPETGVIAASFVYGLVNQSSSSDSCQIYGLRVLGSLMEEVGPVSGQFRSIVGLGYRFGGHGSQSTEESDHFKLLEADGDSLLVGARLGVNLNAVVITLEALIQKLVSAVQLTHIDWELLKWHRLMTRIVCHEVRGRVHCGSTPEDVFSAKKMREALIQKLVSAVQLTHIDWELLKWHRLMTRIVCHEVRGRYTTGLRQKTSLRRRK